MRKLSSEEFRISGRTTYIGDILYLGFSGSFAEFMTSSDTVEVVWVTDEKPEEPDYRSRVAVYIDDECEPAAEGMLNDHISVMSIRGIGRRTPAGAESAPEMHKVRIEKLSEAAFGLAGIKEIRIDDDAKAFPTAVKEHKIEFIGDSITCGYGVGATDPLSSFKTCEENAEDGYAIRTARALDAEYQLVSWSGTGTITNWIPEDVNEPLDEMLMPNLYPYRDRRLNEKLGMDIRKWDFDEYRPQLIVINLGTNDDSYVRKIPERENEYIPTMDAFLDFVHRSNPDSAILWIMGIMGQNLCAVQKERIRAYAEAHPKLHIEYLELNEQNAEADGYAADYHPSVATHIHTAETLTKEIRRFMNW